MIEYLTTVTSNGYTILYNILLAVLAVWNIGFVIAMVIRNTERFGGFQHKKDVIALENKDGKWIWD